MANTTLNVNCGCGRKFTDLESAQLHADVQKHTLTILGTVRPETLEEKEEKEEKEEARV